jgi:hypothetical protein
MNIGDIGEHRYCGQGFNSPRLHFFPIVLKAAMEVRAQAESGERGKKRAVHLFRGRQVDP